MSALSDNAGDEGIGIHNFASKGKESRMLKKELWMQVGYAEKISNVWAKVAEETSQYDREKQTS